MRRGGRGDGSALRRRRAGRGRGSRLLRLLALALGVAAAAAAWRRRPEVGVEPPDLTGSPPPLVERPPRAVRVAGNEQVLGPAWEPATLAALASWVPSPPSRPLTRALAYAWAVPMSLAGLLFGAASGVRPVLRDGVLLFRGARGPAAALLKAQRYDATTLGHVVVARTEPSPTLFAHELVHVRQAERLGVLFGPVYVLLWLVYGYGRHPLERAARLGGRQAVRTQGAGAAR